MAKAKTPKKIVKRKTPPRKRMKLEDRPKPKEKQLKAEPDPYKAAPKKHGWEKYTLKKIANYERMHPNHNAAVDALTKAFQANKRIAIVDEGIDVNKIPKIWIAMADYVEVDEKIIKAPEGVTSI